jgi:hypothetical protein
MKKAAVLGFAVLFSICLFHFYYAEDHCPVHCPSRGGQLGHVHPHHADAGICLCFWSSLAGPESGDVLPAAAVLAVLAPPAAGRVLGMTADDLTPPPKSSLV